MQAIERVLDGLLGLQVEDLRLAHMALRAVVVYIAALIMVRMGEKRFLGKNTAFDVILGIIFGSVVSRAITGSSPFFPTLGAGLVLILLHWLFAAIAFRSDQFGNWVKGASRILAQDGKIRWAEMSKSNISEKDLMSALRTQANIDSLDEVQEARLERSGDISVLKVKSKPKILEIRVAEAVQTVRLQIG